MKLMNFEKNYGILTQAYNEILEMAENMFGGRDSSWTFIGIEYRPDGPYICNYSSKQISIVLSSECAEPSSFLPQLYYQLSHEVCHLLYPTGQQNAYILEEGISTYFSKVYLDH